MPNGMATYIVFKKVPSKNSPTWMETVEGLDKAKKRLMHYAGKSNEEFYLFDVKRAQILDVAARAQRAS
jgi:hypothetical protein